MPRPRFPRGMMLPIGAIDRINEEIRAYDKDPEEYERRERRLQELREEEEYREREEADFYLRQAEEQRYHDDLG